MTLREAVNEILLNINELPLDDTDIIEDINVAIFADKFLDISRKHILSKGWYFNSVTYTLTPNVSGYIVIPKSFLSIDSSTDSEELVNRDWKIYDKANATYIFTEPKTLDVIEDIVFDDIPYSVANYIVKSASLMAYSNIVGDVSGIQSRAAVLQQVKADALREDANKMDGNILSTPYATTLLDRTSI